MDSQTETFIELAALVVCLLAAAVAAIWCIQAVLQHRETYKELDRRHSYLWGREHQRERRKVKRRAIGFLIGDHSMELAKQIAAMFNVNPLTQKSEFDRICAIVREALAQYEQKARHMNKRVYADEGSLHLGE